MSRGGLLSRLRSDRWMFVPIALLGLTVVTGFATVMSAVVGHPLGTEPAYDRKAASWEAEREQRAMNERLRWVVTPDIASAGAKRVLTLTVEDKHAARIDAERVRVECIPIRNAEARLEIALHRDAEGSFSGGFDSPIGGQWEFRVAVEDGELRYTDAFRRFLTPAAMKRGAVDG
jgi:hypothetical protein